MSGGAAAESADAPRPAGTLDRRRAAQRDAAPERPCRGVLAFAGRGIRGVFGTHRTASVPVAQGPSFCSRSLLLSGPKEALGRRTSAAADSMRRMVSWCAWPHVPHQRCRILKFMRRMGCCRLVATHDPPTMLVSNAAGALLRAGLLSAARPSSTRRRRCRTPGG